MVQLVVVEVSEVGQALTITVGIQKVYCEDRVNPYRAASGRPRSPVEKRKHHWRLNACQ